MYREKRAIIGLRKYEMSQYNFIKNVVAQKEKEHRIVLQKNEITEVSNV